MFAFIELLLKYHLEILNRNAKLLNDKYPQSTNLILNFLIIFYLEFSYLNLNSLIIIFNLLQHHYFITQFIYLLSNQQQAISPF